MEYNNENICIKLCFISYSDKNGDIKYNFQEHIVNESRNLKHYFIKLRVKNHIQNIPAAKKSILKIFYLLEISLFYKQI